MVTQNGVPIFHRRARRGIRACKLFADGYCYVAAIPTYVGGHMAMGWHRRIRSCVRRRSRLSPPLCAGRPFPDQILTPLHVAAFALPRFMADRVAKAIGR